MLVLIRHGESEDNEIGKMGGQLNSSLTSLGKHQVNEAKKNLSGYNFDAVFTSDLLRAIETTQGIIGHRVPESEWILAEELRERSGGVYEGMTYTELWKMLPPKKYKLWQRDYFEAPPLGESLSDLYDRVIPYFKEYVVPLVNQNKYVLVVSHANVMKVIIGFIKGLDETAIINLPYAEHAIPYVLYGKVNA